VDVQRLGLRMASVDLPKKMLEEQRVFEFSSATASAFSWFSASNVFPHTIDVVLSFYYTAASPDASHGIFQTAASALCQEVGIR
jgi:hypothetical protein